MIALYVIEENLHRSGNNGYGHYFFVLDSYDFRVIRVKHLTDPNDNLISLLEEVDIARIDKEGYMYMVVLLAASNRHAIIKYNIDEDTIKYVITSQATTPLT